MKALVVYVSVHHGNTEKVARAMADALDACLLPVEQADAGVLEEYDLIGFGSGIYFGRHHRSLLNLVDGLPVLRNKKAFVFSSSGLRKVRFVHDFHRPLKEKLRRKGLTVIGEFSCRGLDTFGATRIVGGINRGRPDEEDLRRSQDFAGNLATS
ncbi:MAG: flavodoxin family protein [Dehalococcoidia bacterium]|nr:flavodoxin family protein [Dehalococcoidia bacterium]